MRACFLVLPCFCFFLRGAGKDCTERHVHRSAFADITTTDPSTSIQETQKITEWFNEKKNVSPLNCCFEIQSPINGNKAKNKSNTTISEIQWCLNKSKSLVLVCGTEVYIWMQLDCSQLASSHSSPSKLYWCLGKKRHCKSAWAALRHTFGWLEKKQIKCFPLAW